MSLARESHSMSSSFCILVMIIVLCLTNVSSVDQSKFRKCSDSSFCLRHRTIENRVSPYKIQVDTVDVADRNDGVWTAVLMNTITSSKLDVRITTLNFGVLRVWINEKDGLRRRYEPPVGDVLIADPQRIAYVVESSSDEGMVIRAEDNSFKAVITYGSFGVDVVVDGEVVMRFNGEGKLNFETQRSREDTSSIEPGTDETNMWSDSFNSHYDSKPYGPMSIGADISFIGSEHVYGIPEHASHLALKPTKGTGISSDPYRLFNLDVFEYELDNPMALYGSIPVMLAHSVHRTVGMFWLNAAETWIDVYNTESDASALSKLWSLVGVDNKSDDNIQRPYTGTHWFSESGLIDVFFMVGPSPKHVFQQYGFLTGTTSLPPLFSIGYHQCRWNYNDEEDVAKVHAAFDENNIPFDVIWLDIEHTDGKRYFTWDPKKFPNSKNMLDLLKSKGRRMVAIVDPHIKIDPAYTIHSQAKDLGYYVKKADGTTDYDGWCWPGSSGYLDFTSHKVRSWWAERFSYEHYAGSSDNLFIWNDMNEPSVFNGPEVSMNRDCLHKVALNDAIAAGDVDAIAHEHRDVHNIFGAYFFRATSEGLRQRSEGKERPFVLSRAFFAGSQRDGAVWTGDNTASWDHLKYSLPMMLTLNVAGLPFAGADVGGFFGNPDAELLVRWYQVGAFSPFFRAHAHLDARRREPWLFDKVITNRIRTAIRQRYAYIPLWYTLFFESSRSGMPIIRPLWVHFPTDPETFSMEDQFLVGDSLMLKPVLNAGATAVSVYLPGEDPWYLIPELGILASTKWTRYGAPTTYNLAVTMDTLPLFHRGGSIVPMKLRARRSTFSMSSDPYTLVVALDEQGNASGTLYLDDGHSTDHETQNRYLLQTFNFNGKSIKAKSHMGDEVSTYTTMEHVERVVVVGLSYPPKSISVNVAGISTSLQFSYDPTSGVLTIKKPNVNISHDWEIEFSV